MPSAVTSLAHLQVVGTLGSGHFGHVLLTYHPAQHRNFAVKVVRSRDPDVREGEGRVLTKLRHQPFFAQLCNTAETEKFVLHRLPVYPGGSLKGFLGDLFQAGTTLSFLDVQSLTAECLVAVNQLHRQLIMHGDICLDNVFVEETGHLVLGDFGASRIIDDRDDVMFSYDLSRLGDAICWLSREEVLDETWTEDMTKDVQDLCSLLSDGSDNAETVMKVAFQHKFFKGVVWSDVEEKKLDMGKLRPPKMEVEKPEENVWLGNLMTEAEITWLTSIGHLTPTLTASVVQDYRAQFKCFHPDLE